MPLRYVNYKSITTPFALTSLGTLNFTLAKIYLRKVVPSSCEQFILKFMQHTWLRMLIQPKYSATPEI